MCFPSKSQNALFSDESTKQTDTKAPAPIVSSSITSPNNNDTSAPTMAPPNIAIVIYTLWGHVAKRACLSLLFLLHSPSFVHMLILFLSYQWLRLRSAALRLPVARLPSTSEYDDYSGSGTHHLIDFTARIAETLPEEVLTKMHAAPKPDYPIITPAELANFDAFLLGIPTRYGNFPAQWKVSTWPSFSSLPFWVRAGAWADIASLFFCRRFGMRPVTSGNRANCTASSLACSSRLVVSAVDRNPPLLRPCPPLPTTASPSFPLATQEPSLN